MGKFKFNMDFVVRFKINNISGMKPMGKIPVKKHQTSLLLEIQQIHILTHHRSSSLSL